MFVFCLNYFVFTTVSIMLCDYVVGKIASPALYATTQTKGHDNAQMDLGKRNIKLRCLGSCNIYIFH